MEFEFEQFVLDDDLARVDREVLWTFLSRDAYWGKWRDRADVTAQLAGSWRVVGAYDRGTGEMVGFARAISDGVAFPYLADVFVIPQSRGRGLGVELVRVMIEAGPGARFLWALHTSNAHELYRRFGFREPDNTFMQRPGRPGRSTSTT